MNGNAHRALPRDVGLMGGILSPYDIANGRERGFDRRMGQRL
jgi:hypothetical protein